MDSTSNRGPSVTVIMTAFNAAKYIRSAIESVLVQTHTDFELLIADDCSSDETQSIIDEMGHLDPRIRADHNAQNMHYLRTRNKLLHQARGAYITFLDADDLMLPHRLQAQFAILETHPELAMCGTAVAYIDEEGNALGEQQHVPLSYEEIRAVYLTQNPFTGSTLMIRKSVFKEQGWYRDFFNGLGCEDYDLSSRILEQHPCINLPEPLYIYRQFPQSTSRASIQTQPFKFHSKTLVRHFAQERKRGLKDSLDRGDMDAIDRIVKEAHQPYIEDPSKFYIDEVTGYLYVGLTGRAVVSAAKAIQANPWKWYNYQTLWYCIKKHYSQ
jgi:glycosyltransferase involved in cell wall biosynthesis